MENYDPREPKRVKEKSVYLLHLDTPRIIIISSVLIAVVIIAFLFGMNYNKPADRDKDLLSQKETVFDAPLADRKDMELLDNKGQNPSGEEGITADKQSLDKSPLVKDDLVKNDDLRRNDPPVTDRIEKGKKGDILPPDGAKDVISSAKDDGKTDAEAPVKKTGKKSSSKKDARKKNQKVVEVAMKHKASGTEDRKEGYSIQVASFDNKTKAQSEVNTLKKMEYDAYVDRAQLKGKDFFRVRIGPVSSKKKALQILNELQEKDKYEESYMVKE